MEAELDVCVVDLEDIMPKVGGRLSEMPSLDVVKHIDIPHVETTMPTFQVNFVPEEFEDATIHVIFLSYYPQFRRESLTALKEWVEKHPETFFITVIFNYPFKTWTSFATAKSKIEEEFSKYVVGGTSCVLKFIEDSEEKISDSDLLVLRDTLELYVGVSLKQRIMKLLENETLRKNTSKETYHLAKLFSMLGYYTDSIRYYSRLQAGNPNDFWPESPSFYNIRKDIIEELSTGYSLLSSSMSGMFHSAVQIGAYEQLYEYVTRCFAWILHNCVSDSQFIFARHFIHFLATSFGNSLEDTDPAACACFTLIALHQVTELFKLKPNWEEPIFKNMPKERKTIDFLEPAFVMEWGKCKALLDGRNSAKSFIGAQLLDFMIWKGDKEGAMVVLKDYDLVPTRKFQVANIFQSRAAQILYEWTKKQELIDILISSRASNSFKLSLLSDIKKIKPLCSLRPVIHAPDLYQSVQLFHSAKFEMEFSPPCYLLGQRVILYVKFKNHYATLKGEEQELELTPRTVYRTAINCRLEGVYDKSVFSIIYKETKLSWNIPVKMPLSVAGYQYVPVSNLIAPCLISRKGELQAALLAMEDIDTDCRSIGISFESHALQGMEFMGQRFEPNEEIVLEEVVSSLKVTLFIDYSQDDQISCNYRFILKDGEEVEFCQSFQFPDVVKIDITLYDQNEVFQQFHIINPFQTTFHFDHNGKSHVIKPMSTYSILRRKTEEPLVLSLKEEGWKEYPVTLTTSELKPEVMKISAELETENWCVGEPRTVTLGEAASVLKFDEEDWVIAKQNMSGKEYLMIPKRPGVLRMPLFVVKQQVVDCNLEKIEVTGITLPPFVPL